MLYDIKKLIEKMKSISNTSTNIALAKLLDISYNTLNTWIKRGKIPQEVLLEFCTRYDCSLDYLLLDRVGEPPTLFSSSNNKSTTKNGNNKSTVKFYGIYPPLNIKPGDSISINKEAKHSPAFYLLLKDNIYFISKVNINPFLKSALIEDYGVQISLKEFNNINFGLIEQSR